MHKGNTKDMTVCCENGGHVCVSCVMCVFVVCCVVVYQSVISRECHALENLTALMAWYDLCNRRIA